MKFKYNLCIHVFWGYWYILYIHVVLFQIHVKMF